MPTTCFAQVADGGPFGQPLGWPDAAAIAAIALAVAWAMRSWLRFIAGEKP